MRLLSRLGLYLPFAILAATTAISAQTIAPGQYAGITPEQVQQIASMLPAKPTGFGPPCSDRAAWSRLAAQFQPQIAQAESMLTEPFPAWSDDAYSDYLRTGSRTRGNQMLAAREHWLAPLVLAECAEGRGRFLPRIAMVLDQLSTQPTWNEAANDADLRDFGTPLYRQTISLDSATLGQNIAEAFYLIGDQLPAETRQHIQTALEQRIYTPMRAALTPGHGYWWMTRDSNWNAVCLDGVTGAALAALPSREDRALFVAAAQLYSPNYLRSFSDSGYGVEGIGYWSYGFSHYADLREALWAATSGKIDLYSNPQARKVALFSIQLQMLPGNFAAFGDAHFMSVPSAPLVAYVEKTFGLDITAPAKPTHETAALVDAVRTAFPNHSELPASSNDDILGLRTYYADPGVLIARPAPGGDLAATIKAGGNGGHSHNDIGSFVIALGATQPIGDPGGPNFYTSDTFSSKRLTSRLLNSYGHPVPVIGAALQKDATKLHPKVLSTSFTPQQDSITIDMTSAYDAPTLKSLARTMKYSREGQGSVEIADNFKLSAPTDIEESLPTHGTWRQIDAKTLEFTIDANAGKEHGPIDPNAKPEHLRVTIEAPTTFTVTDEKIDDYGNPFTRVAIHLHLKKSGTITLHFTPAD
ncbi:hypothetical protein GCM10011507_11930 [Edaphobacter acidisoli]|uniref:Heparinase II/III-like protein n=1 Tax=Edaphobacter acidisoli TaxID=2040573 RepID=A0A916W2F0_9BACT|nr:hypothetical protein [Edaphobacter acidisoli]GGA62002.1 hypothetical protein GCM10011507_11930 [Edaphobacter acidisoli]